MCIPKCNEIADFDPENPHYVHASKENAHIAEKVPGSPAVNALQEILSATNARGWDTLAGCVTLNLGTGSSRVLKLYQLKLHARLRNKSLKTACQNTVLPI